MIKKPIVQTLLAIVSALALNLICLQANLAEDPTAVTIPLEIEINGISKGDVIVRASASLDIIEIQGTSLKELLKEIAADELTEQVESLPDTYSTLEEFRKLGIEIELDLERLVIVLSIQEKVDPLSLLPRSIHLGYQRELHYDTHARQAKVSGYANLRWSSNYSKSNSGSSRARNNLNISHVVNVGGYAIEGESVWNDSRGFRTRQLRVVHDFPNRLWRASLGDISTPIANLQRGFQLFGVNLVKEFGLQPYRTFTPTGSAAFELKEASTVLVSVNGRVKKTLELEPGLYNIEEFKLVAGQNSMNLQIESESGLVDTLNVNEFGSSNLLGNGVSTYAISFGLPQLSVATKNSLKISGLDWYQRYAENEPIYSAYYKKGIHNQLTMTASIQGSAQWNRIGLSAITAGERIGNFDAAVSYNQSKGNPAGISARARWNKRILGYGISLSGAYTDSGFELFRDNQSPAPKEVNFSQAFGISKLFFKKTNVSIRAFQNKAHNGDSSKSIAMSIGRRVKAVYLSGSFRQKTENDVKRHEAYLNLTWSPTPKWRTQSRVRYNSQSGGTELSSRMNYANRTQNTITSGSIDAQAKPNGYAVNGNYSLTTPQYSIDLSHQQAYDSIDEYITKGNTSSFALRTSIAFADGAIARTRIVRDSFAIIAHHQAWKDVTLGINPTLGGYEKKGKKSFFSPMLANHPSYKEGYASIQTIDSDLFLDRNDYYFFPSYRRGSKITVGSDAIYNFRSTLFYSYDEPVSYKSIQITSEDGATTNTFTNKVGRFFATNLKPGKYTLKETSSKETTTFIIEEGETMIFVEKVVLEKQ